MMMTMRMQQNSRGFLVLLLVVFIAGIALSGPSTPRRSRVRRQNMKVRINATGDTIVMKFLRPNADTKLEGYILGYGSSMFSKQFIPLPDNGQPYETEFDAEPKYLIAVQPIPTNEVKKQCTGKVELQKPLHLVIGSVTPTSVLLSWGTLLKTPYDGNIMNDCLEDGHYTVRYRERSRKWNYQTCATSDTVIDNLKPNTVYEFCVQPSSKDVTGTWSKPVIHNISSGGLEEKSIRKIFKQPLNPVKPIAPGPRYPPSAPRHALHNKTQGRLPISRSIASKTTLAPTTSTTTTTRQKSLSPPGPTPPTIAKQPIDVPGGGDLFRSVLPPFFEIPLAPKHHPTLQITPTVTSVPVTHTNVEKHGGHLQHREKQTTTQTQQTIKLILQTQPQPQPTSKLIPQTQPQPQPTSKLIPQTQPQPQATSKLIPQTQPQPQPTSKLILQTQPQPQATSKLIPQTQPQPQPTSKLILQTQPQPQATSKLIPQTQPQPQPTSKLIPQTQPQPQPTSKLIPQTQPQPKLTTKTIPLTQPQPQPTSKLIPQTQPQHQPTLKTIPQTQPQPQPTSKPIPQTQPQPQPTPKLIPQTQPTPKLIPQTQPQPTSKLIPQTQPQLQPTSKLIPQTQPQPQLTPKPIPQTQPQPQPTSKPIPKTRPQPQPTPKLIPQTQPQPQPTSKHIPQTQPQPQPTSKPTSQIQHQPQPTSELKPQTQPKSQPTTQQMSHSVPQTQPPSKLIPQVQPQTTSKRIPQTQPQPQPTSQPLTQTQPQPQTTSEPVPQTQPKSQPTPQQTFHSVPQTQPQSKPKFHTQSQSRSQQRPNIQSEPKTTTQLWAVAKPQPTLHPKHPGQHKTPPQIKTQALPQPHAQPSPQPTYMAHAHTPSPTSQDIPHTQQALPIIHIQPQSEPQSPTTPQPQTQTQPQPTTHPQSKQNAKKRSKVKPTSQSKMKFVKPKDKIQSQPKTQPKPKMKLPPKEKKKKQPTPQPKLKTMDKKKSQTTTPQSQPLPKTQTLSKPEPLPKPHPAPKSHSHPQLGPSLQPQTWTYSDPTKVTPRHTVPTAPSPPEEGKPLPRPALATERVGSNNLGTGIQRPSKDEVPRSPISSSVPAGARNNTVSRTRIPTHSTHVGVRPRSPSKTLTSSHSSSTPGVQPAIPVNKRPNLVGKPTDYDKLMDLKQGGKESILKPFPLVTAKPKQERRQQTTTPAPAVNSSHFDIYENSSIFRPLPASDLDIMGKKRFVAPHVIYKTDKKPDEPCSITSSLSYFPDEEGNDQNVTSPPRLPPSNLTVVTVEGCPSFVILDWQKSDNETREYEVVSTAKGPNGQEVSILTTNQTHTAVENLKPESNYEFIVTPKNELGTGTSTDPVTFSTESADPRVSEYVAGKDAIWTQFPFKADDYSECNGKQYVKRTWYRKFVGIQLCNSLRYKIYLSDSLNGKFYNIGDQTGHGEDHCQFVDSFLDGRTGTQMFADQLPSRPGFYRALRQEPVHFGEIGGKSHVTYVGWYECGTPIPGKW
ncbi:target of Nesh-SH3 isoform X2 [Paralichthys olivaceus]|uniref:target of Nesh-SH3 isoform X2 n=1 Tax=Paralichthys olivaceus TaxID=8255 RepID=UPI00375363A1